MHFKDMKLSRRGSPDGVGGGGGTDSMPSTPAEAKNGWRGRSSSKTTEATNSHYDTHGDSDLSGRQPKRTNSFGKGLGGFQSLANGMSRAGESLSRKTTGTSSDGTKTPPVVTSSAQSSTIPMGPPSLPDSSHLAQFSLKLSELVNRSFMPCTGVQAVSTTPSSGGLAGAAKNAAAMTSVGGSSGIPSLSTISYEGKKLPSKAIVTDIARTVVKELEYSSSVDPYLLRAVSRSALKALSLFADRIDSLLVSPSKDSTVNFIPSTAKEGIHIPTGLEFNLGLVTLEWIVEDALERCIEGPPGTVDEGMPHFVSEILTPVRKKMEGTILHIIQPVISNVKASLTQCLSKAVPMPFSGFGHALTPISSVTSPAFEVAPPTPSGIISPTGTSSHSSSWLRELEGRLEGNRRLLIPRIEERCGQDGEGWFISIAIHLIWKGLFILTSRTMPMPPAWTSKQQPNTIIPPISQLLAAEASKRSPSPAQLTNALKSVAVMSRKGSGSETPSGHATPISLHAGLSTSAKHTLQQVQELQAFEKLVVKFASGFEPSHVKTRVPPQAGVEASDSSDESSDDDDDDDDDEEDELARAALAEALQAIKSTILVIQYLDTQPEAILEAILPHKDRPHSSTLPIEAIRAAKAIPNLLLLHLIYARMPTHLTTFASVIKEGGQRTEAIVPSPPSVFSYTWNEYERAIVGFAGGQTWANALMDAWKEDLVEANEALEVREKKLLAKGEEDEDEQVQEGIVSRDNLDPSESTPTPESVLLRRTASTRSTSDSSESLPEEMTASAPTLDREKAKLTASTILKTTTTTSSSSNSRSSSPWSTLKLPRRGTSRMNEGISEGVPSSPEISPPRSPMAVPVVSSQAQSSTPKAAGESVATITRPKRFWRTQSSQQGGHSNGGFHLSSVGRTNSRGISPNRMSPTITEDERLQEEIRLEKRGVQLLQKALSVVESIRKPATA